MKNKLATIIRAVNYVKSGNIELFAKLCKDLGFNYETLLFRISVWWSSKVNMFASVYEIKDKLTLIFEAHGKQDLLLSIKSKEFHLMLANLVDIIKAFNDLKLFFRARISAVSINMKS